MRFFAQKTLLELGCGHADNGMAFAEAGCSVTASDARVEHINVARARHPKLTFMLFDADRDLVSTQWDIVLHWGLLYHLNMSNVEAHIQNVCAHTNYLFLETEVADCQDTAFKIQTDECGYDQAFNGIGSRLSESFIEFLLEKQGFLFKKVLDPILNFDIHVYDWHITNSKEWKHGLRRFWICWKTGVSSPIVPSTDDI